MTTYFKHIAQITARADYDKILRKALATPGQEPFHYFDAFPFDKKEAPLVLVGDVAKPLIADLKKLVPKAQYGMGVCTVTAKDEIIFERETGKLQPKLVSAAVKLSGIKSTVKFNGEDDEEEGERAEAENDEGQPEEAANVAQVKAKPDVPPVNVRPPSQKPSSDKPAPTPSPRAKEFQDKLKTLRPSFDEALKKARALKKKLWAEDLESNFAQMAQEAKAGKFDAALQTLALLARLIKTEEASRAEVKHQANKEDPDYAEMHKNTTRENVTPQDFKDMRKSLKETGYGVTGDGNVTYALPLKPGEWKSGVLGRIDALSQILSAEPADYEAVEKTYIAALELVKRAEQHAQEGEDQARESAIWQVSSRLIDLNAEITKLVQRRGDYAPPSGPEILKRSEDLRDLVTEMFASTSAPRPKENEVTAFKQKLEEGAVSRRQALNEQAKEHERAVERLREMALALKEEAGELSRQEIDQRRKQLEQMQEVLQERGRELAAASINITEEVKQFRDGVRNPERFNHLLNILDKLRSLITRKYFQQAHDAAEDIVNLLSIEGFGQEDPAEEEILREFSIVQGFLNQHAMIESASPQKVLRLLKRIKSDAQKVSALMD